MPRVQHWEVAWHTNSTAVQLQRPEILSRFTTHHQENDSLGRKPCSMLGCFVLWKRLESGPGNRKVSLGLSTAYGKKWLQGTRPRAPENVSQFPGLSVT